MPPKKRDRDNDSSKNRPTDQYQADHELFLNAFESKFTLPDDNETVGFILGQILISTFNTNRKLTSQQN